MTQTRWTYAFQDGSGEMRSLLGGKGANLAEMTRVLGRRYVPAGFTITTSACVAYLRDGQLPPGLDDQLRESIAGLERSAGKSLGDPSDPLLVAVRSGAPESMPGMMDTILNLGLNRETVDGLAAKTCNERFAWDCYRRFIQMYGTVVGGTPAHRFEEMIAATKTRFGLRSDAELGPEELRQLVADFTGLTEVPSDPWEQLHHAVTAVFDSWMGKRAVAYRRIHGLPDIWGTAASVQQMVFGNKGHTSGSGVAFSRDGLTGASTPSGEFLDNAQGEDVVSGVKTPRDIRELYAWQPHVHSSLMEILRQLERHYGDIQDSEFTVEEGRLFILQTRTAKRPAQASVRFAIDAVEEELLDKPRALLTIDADKLESILHPSIDVSAAVSVLTRGIGASPGAAKGVVVFSASEAIAAASEGRAVILARQYTEADDVAGFHASRGILTSEGGNASHAALVARGMGVPAVTGATELEIVAGAGEIRVGGQVVLRRGDLITLDGASGIVTTDDVALTAPSLTQDLRTVLEWADEIRTMGVRANADTPDDARRARELGAQGIGLCRTEHMFFGEERQGKFAEVILAANDEARAPALSDLLAIQQNDFVKILEAMDGLPVTIRLLDPPLHEFLPKPWQLLEEIGQARAEKRSDLTELQETYDRVRALEEVNPMLGTRGVRLGLLYPAIYEMQIEAIFGALAMVRDAGIEPAIEILVPLVDYRRELQLLRQRIDAIGSSHGLHIGHDYLVGTMIELPRACLTAGEIAHEADFYSFGTNDLTQTVLGFSRDDIEGRILGPYIELKVFDRSPFETLDRDGVGTLVEMGISLGRGTKPDLKIGVCGEHGGDPDSIDFFHCTGIDYVSCSPYRVPVARLAAAQAELRRRAHARLA